MKLQLKRASPTILTVMGATGVIATTITAVKATPKALRVCESIRAECLYEKDREPTRFEYIKGTWTCYIPSFLIGVATIGCIFGSNSLNKKQQASFASAYMILDRSYKEYKRKVKELYGNDSDVRIKEAIAKDKYREYTAKENEPVIFYEEYYGKVFERSPIDVLNAEYELNRKFTLDGEVSLNYFFEILGLDPVEDGDILGWSREKNGKIFNWIEFSHDICEMDDGMECRIINIFTTPILGYNYPF